MTIFIKIQMLLLVIQVAFAYWLGGVLFHKTWHICTIWVLLGLNLFCGFLYFVTKGMV